MKKNAICAACGGALVAKKIKYDQHWGEQIAVFEDVPASVCPSCGEIWLGSKVVRMMDRVLSRQQRPDRRISVPVWSLARLKVA